MKKNIAMRLASGIMLASLLSTCVISGTFAKYTTNDTSNDEARVAKFGVTVTATDNSLFKKTYETDNNDVKASITNSVNSTGYVLAPGTNGTLTSVGITGEPEVAVSVSYDAELTLTGWSVDGDPYCPLVFTVGDDEFELVDTVANLEAAVEEAIEAYAKNYAPNFDLSTVEKLVVKWAWAFEGNDDAKDTKLGNDAAGGNAPTIALTITTTVEQID